MTTTEEFNAALKCLSTGFAAFSAKQATRIALAGMMQDYLVPSPKLPGVRSVHFAPASGFVAYAWKR